MNSDMFMQWVDRKLIPTFKVKYPGKKMVLVADDAPPYHHKREVGSLNGLNKKELIALCQEHRIDYLDLPGNTTHMDAFDSGLEEYSHIEEVGDYYSLTIDYEDKAVAAEIWKEIGMTAAATKRPFTPTNQELKLAMVAWMCKEKPELLACKVEARLESEGFTVLWTPPYCSELQPIELFWAAGKNYAARHCWTERTMRQTV